MSRFLSIMAWSLVLVSVFACDEASSEKEERARAAAGQAADGVITLSEAAASRVRIETRPVKMRAFSGVLTTTGRVDFNHDRLAHVSPRVPGRVHQVQATLGDQVKAEQTLAVIDSIELGRAKSALIRAEAVLDFKRRTLEREQVLLEDQITSEQAVLEARSTYRSAQAEYQAAKQELRLLGLSERQIRTTASDDPAAALFPLSSPLAGTIVEKHVSLGEMVSPARSLFTVADLSRVWIWIDVYERDLERVHLEDDVAVRVDAARERTFEGKVAYVRPQVDPETRTARARIDVPNPSGELRPGMFATVTVTDPHGAEEGEHAPSSLVVPSEAIQRDGRARIAFVALGAHRYARRVVRAGREADAYVEVLDGLEAGESVVTEGAFILKSEAQKHRMGGGH